MEFGTKQCIWNSFAHKSFVRGLSFVPETRQFLSCSDDKTVKLWSLESEQRVPLTTFYTDCLINCVDHKRNENIFATAEETLYRYGATSERVPFKRLIGEQIMLSTFVLTALRQIFWRQLLPIVLLLCMI